MQHSWVMTIFVNFIAYFLNRLRQSCAKVVGTLSTFTAQIVCTGPDMRNIYIVSKVKFNLRFHPLPLPPKQCWTQKWAYPISLPCTSQHCVRGAGRRYVWQVSQQFRTWLSEAIQKIRYKIYKTGHNSRTLYSIAMIFSVLCRESFLLYIDCVFDEIF